MGVEYRLIFPSLYEQLAGITSLSFWVEKNIPPLSIVAVKLISEGTRGERPGAEIWRKCSRYPENRRDCEHFYYKNALGR